MSIFDWAGSIQHDSHRNSPLLGSPRTRKTGHSILLCAQLPAPSPKDEFHDSLGKISAFHHDPAISPAWDPRHAPVKTATTIVIYYFDLYKQLKEPTLSKEKYSQLMKDMFGFHINAGGCVWKISIDERVV
ncbi:hypothetical protein ACMFMG_011701 [Clarireedia jacksonii]